MRVLMISVVPLVALVATSAQEFRPAEPVEATKAILDAFASHQVVALGEGSHGNLQGAAFRSALVRDPRVADIVNDIVVETGNARYQAEIDRYVRGEDVPATVVRDACRDTTNIGTIVDLPVFQQIFHDARAVNQGRPPDRRLRILLGDPPIDWSRVREIGDTYAIQRDRFVADLIVKESTAKKRRTLVIYGDLHFPRGSKEALVSLLEARGVPVFSIWTTTQNSLAFADLTSRSWPVLSVTKIKGTQVGAHLYPQWNPLPLEQQVDAVFNAGVFIQQPFPRELCADEDYLKLRTARLALQGREDELRQRCSQ